MARCNTVYDADLLRLDCATWPAEEAFRWIQAFDPALPGKPPWVRQTQYQNAGVYTRYLACMRRCGLPDCLHAQGVRQFVIGCEASGLVARTIAGYVQALVKVSRIIGEAGSDYAWLHAAAARMDRAAAQTMKRKRGFIPPAEEILLFALDTVADAKRRGPGTWTDIQLYRDGLFLGFGIVVPERLRALSSLRLRDCDIAGMHATFDGEVMKTKTGKNRKVHAAIAALLVEWLNEWRPITRPSHDGIWVAKSGNPARGETLYAAMRKLTASAPWGYPISPHRLRDSAATFLTRHCPETVEFASLILGHKSSTSTLHYTEEAGQVSASRRAAVLLNEARTTVLDHSKCLFVDVRR
jgi:integrase